MGWKKGDHCLALWRDGQVVSETQSLSYYYAQVALPFDAFLWDELTLYIFGSTHPRAFASLPHIKWATMTLGCG